MKYGRPSRLTAAIAIVLAACHFTWLGSEQDKSESVAAVLTNTSKPRASSSNPPWNAAVVGAGSWGTTVAKMIAMNTAKLKNWENRVNLQLIDEMVVTDEDLYKLKDALVRTNGTGVIEADSVGSRLSKIINARHVNAKYLPRVPLPTNIVAEPDMQVAIGDADVIVLGVPDQFVKSSLSVIKHFLKPSARIIVLSKGMEFENNALVPVSEVVTRELGIDGDQVCVLMGANIAIEVAVEKFSESTLGCRRTEDLAWLKPIFEQPFFRIGAVTNVEGPQLCGALKNVIAIGKGLIAGQGASANTISALMRIGMKEMRGIISEFYDVPERVWWESCCFADVITTCLAGRNQHVAEQFARRGGKVSFEMLEAELLNGQRLQGTVTAVPVHDLLVHKRWTKKYPFFEAVYQVVATKAPPGSIFRVLETVPQSDDGL
eukprot:TRINITY_DN61611_c0_g1_i1.p1 TRINITY_DN61611_c0_g1~~TRINITY_DN61611_c0_g1_i1.p1  ORF type:complete len:432 (-),score=64.44 TRINITY_DN61611_c0_g1_i1:539-1834(-)